MKLSIRAKLIIGFTSAFLLIISLGITSFIIRTRQTQEDEWVKHTYKTLNQIQTIQKYLSDMETGRRGYRSTGSTLFLAPYSEALPIIKPSLAELKNMVMDSKEEENKATILEQKVDSLLSFWAGFGTKAREFSKDEILAITTAEKQHMDAIHTIIVSIEDTANQLLNSREKQFEEANAISRIFLVASFVLMLLIICGLIYFIFKEFKNRQQTEYELQENVEKLEVLNKGFKENNMALKGVASVHESIQGLNDPEAIAKAALDALVNYFRISAGAFYLFNEQSKKLVLAASHALNNNAPKLVELNQGMLGQAAMSKTITNIKVPSDYTMIQSATFSAPVSQVVFFPLYFNDELKGIIELLSIRNIRFTSNLDLATVVANNLAIAINTAQESKKVVDLLEQVQEQRESLLSQQEELRQTNEELNKQTEELQESEEELKAQEEELRQINSELEERNEAVESARIALAEKAKELEITSKYKSEFLANMSHELRTPLNSVLILAKLLADNNNNNLTNKQIEYANIIHKSGNDLLELINNILDLSKIEAGKIDINITDVAISTIANDMKQLFTVLAQEKGIDFKINIANDIGQTLQTDKLRIEQIAKNLLSNSFKFTKKNGEIMLSFSNRNKFNTHMLAISVTDNGIGIPEEKQKLIFEAFQQADGSTSRKYGGTGLGLSITKELTHLLGGEIELYSEHEKGSTFTIFLPYKKEISETKKNDVAEEKKEVIIPTKIMEQTTVVDEKSSISHGDKTMLIVEDDARFASILQDFAQNKGYKTIVALQGDEGWYYAKKYKPSAIILDLQLPVIDGWSILSLLKNDPELKHIPVHIMSAFDDNKVNHNGALAFLKKPIDKNGLEQAFASIGIHLQSQLKQVLILSDYQQGHAGLEQLFHAKHSDTEFHHALNIEDARQQLQKNKFDCLIADIGKNIEKGINDLQFINHELQQHSIPVIIYLDTDISNADELKLKKISEVIVRNSTLSDNRIMDELELFLYKVQEVHKKPQSKFTSSASNDNNLKNKKALVVDDDMRNVFALSSMLESQQMEVVIASDGREAVEKLEKDNDVDIVLMDIMMPEMDGYEAMQHIRKKMKLHSLPIIALTAKAMADDRQKCIEAGASDYITKPVDIQKLFSLMRVWLAHH
jgi:signal transduction histidine kinase/DNA-binding response OmpR family regulator/CHASE3 domain sensor protein